MASLVGVYVVATAGYVVIESQSLLDAAYMAAITISTVGFQETFEMDRAGRLWTMFVIVFGAAGASFALTSLVSLYISGDVRQLLDKRKVQIVVDRLKKHIILCGYGRMGELAAEDLKKHNTRVVVVERDAETCRRLSSCGIAYVEGDATDDTTLLQAGLLHASALVAALPHDADNVYVTLTARGIRPDLTIVARAELSLTEPKLKRAGATRVICPQVVGANKIVSILTRPNVVDFVEVAATGVELEMEEFAIDPKSPLCGMSLRDAPIRKTAGATVVAIKRTDGQTIYHPGPDEIMQPEDMLIIIGRAGISSRMVGLQPAN